MTKEDITDPEYRRVERVDKLLEHLLADYSSYHNHKENMAHAILLVQLAVFGAVASTSPWPPAWVSDVTVSFTISKNWLASLAVFAVWALSHFLLRWQLQRRRWAALRYAGTLRTVRDWALSPPDQSDLEPWKAGRKVRLRAWRTILDYLLPPIGTLENIGSDVSDEGFPKGLVTRITEQNRTGAVRAEWVLTMGSYLILAGLAIRTFLSNS